MFNSADSTTGGPAVFYPLAPYFTHGVCPTCGRCRGCGQHAAPPTPALPWWQNPWFWPVYPLTVGDGVAPLTVGDGPVFPLTFSVAAIP